MPLAWRKSEVKALLMAFLSLVVAQFALPLLNDFAPPGNVSAALASEQKSSPQTKETKASGIAAPKLKEGDYPRIGRINSRVAVWLAAQLHLYFAAFVLAVPIFVLIIEAIGMGAKDPRYDRIAYEFIKVSITAFSLTAISGGLLAFFLIAFYPQLFSYLASIFGPAMLVYALLFLGESASLYIYYYGWHRMTKGAAKWLHFGIGIILNLFGLGLMVTANAWSTFMMAPSGVSESGALLGGVWGAIRGPLWFPLNIHRFIANIAFGGSIVGAYAAYRFLSSESDEERAHYDWMGYTSNFIAIGGLIPLPFAGYWLTAEMYAYSQQMGITLMGGMFAWLFIIQAVLIGVLFLSANYYLWCGMERIEGSERYTPYIKYIAFVLVLCFLVWFTPHTLVMTPKEVKALGGSYHPLLGPLGLMPAKNTAVNIMIMFTFLSFLLYRRSGKWAPSSRARYGSLVQGAIFIAAGANIVLAGVYGYFVPTTYKVGSSIPQVATTLSVILFVMIIDALIFRGAKAKASINWGKMPARAQYALILLAISFTWLMGLMGFARSAIRQNWHVYTVFRDSSSEAYTPTLGYTANVVSVSVLIFMALVIFIFWLSQFGAEQGATGQKGVVNR